MLPPSGSGSALRRGDALLERAEHLLHLLVHDRLQDALAAAGKPIVSTSCNPPHRVWAMLRDPEASRAGVRVESR